MRIFPILAASAWLLAGVLSCGNEAETPESMGDADRDSIGATYRSRIDRARDLMYADSTWQDAAAMLNEVASRYYTTPEDTSVRNSATVALRLLAEIQMEHSYDYEKAYKTLTTARMIAEEDGNDFQKAFIYGKLSALYYWAADGDPEVERQSYGFLMQAADYALKSANRESMLTAALNMAVVTLDNDTIWRQFRPIADRILSYGYQGEISGKADPILHMVRGRAYFLDGNPEAAEKELEQAYNLTGYATSANRLRYTADTFMYHILLARRDYEAASAILRRSLENATLHGHLDYQLAIYKKMSDCFNLMNENDSSESYRNKYLDLEFRFQDRNGYGRIKEYNYLDRIDKIDSEVRQLSIKVQNDKRKKLAAYFTLAIICILLAFALYALLTLRRRHKLLYLKNVEMSEREKQNKLLREALESEIESLKTPSETSTPEALPDKVTPTRKRKSESEELTAIYTKALAFMESSDAIYQTGFTVTELSAMTHIPERMISKAINTCHNANFHQLLNEYRIRKVTEIMRSEAARNLTIESIATQAGFKSRPHFIQVFKRMVGVSPSEYLRFSDDQHSSPKAT